jgi:putative transcriptional regulator
MEVEMAKKKKPSLYEDLKESLEEAIAFSQGKKTGARVHRVRVPDQVDVKSVRSKLKMTQPAFSETFGFSLDNIKSWESGRREPTKSARLLLVVIDQFPEAVLSAASANKFTETRI